MSPLENLSRCSPCAKTFNAAAPAAEAQKPPMPLHLICPCYRPKF